MVVWWYVFFYGSYIINWTFNPFMMGYTESGNFTIKGKSWDSVKYNFPWYVLYIGLFILFCIVMWLTAWGKTVSSNAGGILAVLLGLNLAFSLLWLALVIGYGMVKIPIQCWQSSDYVAKLDFHRHKVAYYDDKLINAVSEKQNNLQQLIFCARDITVDPEFAE